MIRLRNCPFHQLAEHHRGVVCGMNLGLIEGILTGLGAEGLRPVLDPQPGHCCVNAISRTGRAHRAGRAGADWRRARRLVGRSASRSSRVQPAQPRSRIRSSIRSARGSDYDDKCVQQVNRQIVVLHLGEVELAGGICLLCQAGHDVGGSSAPILVCHRDTRRASGYYPGGPSGNRDNVVEPCAYDPRLKCSVSG